MILRVLLFLCPCLVYNYITFFYIIKKIINDDNIFLIPIKNVCVSKIIGFFHHDRHQSAFHLPTLRSHPPPSHGPILTPPSIITGFPAVPPFLSVSVKEKNRLFGTSCFFYPPFLRALFSFSPFFPLRCRKEAEEEGKHWT
jgi:hypothetical protein